MTTIDRLVEEASHLSPDERGELLDRIGAIPDPEWEAAWAEEVERRDAEMDAGAPGVPWEQVRARMYERSRDAQG